ncbi:MAG: type IV toxin-antitoxin system AbiEi family antitoxin domain-containing protein [Bryobacteraceae bacterium]
MSSPQSPHERQKELYQLAESQSGYFTTKQANALGYASNKRIYHIRAGNWIREHRGIYRLTRFPEPERSDLILWWLWSRDRSDRPSGVYSHQTALSLHDLTDANPAKLDLTVPTNFRRGVPIPRVLRLHYDDVRPEDQETLSGVPVTNAIRSILDVWKEESLPKPVLREAFRQAMKQGKITKTQVAIYQHDAERAPVFAQIRKGTK